MYVHSSGIDLPDHWLDDIIQLKGGSLHINSQGSTRSICW